MPDDLDPLFPTIERKVSACRPQERVYEWPLTAALIWTVWQNVVRANAEWTALVEEGSLTWCAADHSAMVQPPIEAGASLVQAFREGDVRAYGLKGDDQEPSIIEPWHWSVLMLEDFEAQEPDGFHAVRVSAADMKRQFPSKEPGQAAFTPKLEDRRLKKLGRPAVYDWPAAAGFAARYMLDNHPLSQAELAAVLRDWFKERNKVPDHRDLERFASKALAP